MNKLRQITFSILWTLVYALILYFFTYSIGIPRSFLEMFTIIDLLDTISDNAVIVTYMIILSLLLISRAIFKNGFISNTVVTLILLLIAIISYYKGLVLNQPFVPTDIMLIGNIGQIVEFGITPPSYKIVISTIILATMLLLQFLFEKKLKFNYKFQGLIKELYRIPLLIVGIIIIYMLCISPNRFKNYNIVNITESLRVVYGNVGTFFIKLGDLCVTVPENYSKEKIEEIKEEYINNNIENESEKINVIFIMCEAFSDPTKIKDINYSVDPLIDIRELIKNDKNSKMGECTIPVLGGGTAVPEFESLTGLSSYYIDKNIFPHTSYITSDMNSLVRDYNKQGYKTIGIHTNTGNFYNRKKVYKHLGFNETIFTENIEEPEYIGGCITDKEFENQIISQFEANKGTDKFLFGVTMQNHMPYSSKPYEKYDINITSNNFNYSENDMTQLKNYVQGVYDDNKMYIELVEYLKKYNEPTLLVMFGDHLPALADYKFYYESNYIESEFYKTPYIMWANYEIDFNNIPDTITIPNLAINLYELSGNSLPWYLKLFKEIYISYNAFNNQQIINTENKFISREELERLELINNGEILQYALLIKKERLE